MVLKANGLAVKSSHKFIIGYTDDETVMLDFDNTILKDVKYWSHKVEKWFKLEGFIVLRSSEKCYHVVFNRPVSWSENCKIMAWVSLLSHNPMLEKWFLMQCIKESSTLRVSPKRQKPSPRIVYRYGQEDEQIQSFLKRRRLIKNMIRKLSNLKTVLNQPKNL